VFLIDEPLAAAIGAGLPVGESRGSLVVDIGGGTSEMAVTSLGGMVVAHSIRVGGYELDEAIVRDVGRQHGLLIGQEQAEALKLEIGSAVSDVDVARSGDVAGRDSHTGLLRRATIDAGQVRTALARPLAQIVEAVKGVLERTPPELSSDIASDGMMVVGGGALLPGISELLRTETGLHVTVPDEPLLTVAQGAGQALENLALLRKREQRRRP
jgi:rod shape-determining protein MreB